MGWSLRNIIAKVRRFRVRIVADVAGNTLAMAAAAMVPLAGLVGGGIDMSRAYMAQSRLQMACDAAALAGRRVMSGGTVDTTVQNEALKFFRFNFPTGEGGTTPSFGVASFVPVVSGGDNMTVIVTANTTVPTSIMSMFGYNQIPISVNCNARLDFRNTDIVLVLDTTGSMLCAPSESSCSNTTEKSTSKIVSLRAAVLALYDTLATAQVQLESQGLRLRYGIVPYSAGVNVGAAIRTVDSNYFRSSKPYQSRVARFDTANTTTTTGTPVVTTETYGSSITKSDCRAYGDNTSFGSFNPSPSGDYSTGTAPSPVTNTSFARGTWNGSTSMSGGGNSTATCTRTKSVTVTTTTTAPGYKFTKWIYQQATFDVSNFRTGGTIPLSTNTSGIVPAIGDYTEQQLAAMQAAGTASGFTTTNSSWSGCIEERDTDPTITSASPLTVPSGAYDLNIDFVPNSDPTRWAPQFDDISYWRSSTPANSGSSSTSYCPQAAKTLQAWTRANLNTYLNSLFAKGTTYHDFGMIWGARFISPTGIFSATNPTTFNNAGVDRYIVFMTDGAMNTDPDNYTLYGIERLDQRVTGGYTTSTNQDNRELRRFLIACTEAKARINALWVIGFAQALTTELTQCASGADKASTIADSASLIAKFQQIGSEIGALRLTK